MSTSTNELLSGTDATRTENRTKEPVAGAHSPQRTADAFPLHNLSDGDSDSANQKAVAAEEAESPSRSFINPYEIKSFDALRTQYKLLIRPDRLRNWRLTYPNTGQLDGFPHFGTVLILATDGIEALYHIDMSNELFKGHLAAFNGPIAKECVMEEDWDYEKRKRRVNVFKRADGSIVIIPRDSVMERYWAKHSRWTKEELQVWEQAPLDEIDSALKALAERVQDAQPSPHAKKKIKSKLQSILDTL